MKLELTRILPNGTGSVVVHLDDGSSFDQSFRGAPVEDPAALREFLTQIADEAIARQIPIQETVIPSEIEDMVGQQVDPVRPTKGVTRAEPA